MTIVFGRIFSVNNLKKSASSILIEPSKFMPTNQMKMETLYVLSANCKLSVTATDES